jgi:hypothetical protein
MLAMGKRRKTRVLVLAVLVGVVWLSGCGTESDLSVRHPPPPPTVGLDVRFGGLVQMPDGRVARDLHAWPQLALFARTADALTAANVRPVGAGVRVSLAVLNPDGSLQPPLATTTTNASGRYELGIPGSRDPASVCHFVAYVGDAASGTLTRRLLTGSDLQQDIDYQSEALVRLLLDRVSQGADFCAVSVLELEQLLARIRSLPDPVVGTGAADINFKARQIAGADEQLQALLDVALAPSPTPVRTPRYTFTASATRTATGTRTQTPTRTATRTRTFTPTITPSRLPTRTFTPGLATLTPTATQTPGVGSPSPGLTPQATPTATATNTPGDTGEFTRTCTLRAGSTASRAVIQARDIVLSINLSGRQEWRFGALDENGNRQILIPREGTVFNRINLPLGVGALCVRLSENSDGFIDCDGGTAGYDTTVAQDHNTSTPPEEEGEFPLDPDCTATETWPDGTVSRASREGDTDPHPGVCNSPVRLTRTGTFPAGGMLLNERLCLRLLEAGSTAPCPPVTEPCNPDAGEFALAGSITSGNANVIIYDERNTNASLRDGAFCPANSQTPCVTKVEGAPFGCENIEAGDLSRGRLGFGFPILDLSAASLLVDLVGTLTIVCQ